MNDYEYYKHSSMNVAFKYDVDLNNKETFERFRTGKMQIQLTDDFFCDNLTEEIKVEKPIVSNNSNLFPTKQNPYPFGKPDEEDYHFGI